MMSSSPDPQVSERGGLWKHPEALTRKMDRGRSERPSHTHTHTHTLTHTYTHTHTRKVIYINPEMSQWCPKLTTGRPKHTHTHTHRRTHTQASGLLTAT